MDDNGVEFPGVGLAASGRLEYDPEHWKEVLELRMDADQRVMWAVRSLVHRRLENVKGPAPIEIPIAFHTLKSAVAQILTVEIQITLEGDNFKHLSKVDRRRWPRGLQGAQNVADHLEAAAELERAGQAALEDGSVAPRPNLDLII